MTTGTHDPARTGDAFFARGEFQQALAQFLTASQREPAAPEHHYRAALAYWALGQHESAKYELEESILLKPQDARAHGALGRVLLAMGQVARAEQHARRATELTPRDADLAVALSAVLEAGRQTDAAWEIIDRLHAAGHASTDMALVFARLAPARERSPEALALATRLLKDPAKTPRERSALHFAMANLLDAAGRFDQAFEQAAQANALRQISYDAVQVEQIVQQWISYFTRATLARLPRPTLAGELPVFIVGMPRSGTSLVEQILASHPAVHGAGELDWISRLCESAVTHCANGQDPSLQCLDHLSAGAVDALASRYLIPLQALAPAALRITDKMPVNFIYLGLIGLLFPQARIIHCRRDAMDTCLSCYLTDFTAGYEFSFSLESLAHFHGQYQRLMAHWKSVLDVAMLEVDYEQLVGDAESQTRKMIEFLGLPWDERCLRPHENRRFVGTASNAQVRRPVYQTSVGRWRNYEKHLGALKQAIDARKNSSTV